MIGSDTVEKGRRFWSAAVREPILHFLVLALLLFGIQALFLRPEPERIEVDRALIDATLRERSALMLRPLTAAEREAAIAAAVDDEILLKEAYRRGLNNTPLVRAQLLLVMRRILAGELDPPDEPTLRRYYASEHARFERPPTLDLEQLLFADETKVPLGTLAALQSGGDGRHIGDFDLSLGPSLRYASEADLVRLFGADAARDILAIDDSDWHGPIHSVRGVHFLRIEARHPAETPSYDEMQPYLAQEWALSEQQRRVHAVIAGLGRDYVIVRSEP
jgi:hypothetical protein